MYVKRPRQRDLVDLRRYAVRAERKSDVSAILGLASDIGRAIKEKEEPHVFVFRSTIAPVLSKI
jgi:hypothetical protein